MTASITITGRLTADPEMKVHVSDGEQTSLTSYRVAYSYDRGAKTGFIDVTTWGRSAEADVQHLSKGQLVTVSGELAYREWDTKQGQKRSSHSVINPHVEYHAKPASFSSGVKAVAGD